MHVQWRGQILLGFTQSGFKTFHVWRLHSILGQPAPLLHCRVGQEISFLICSELLSSHYALCLWADAPNPDLGILVVLHWITPLWQYLCVPSHGLFSPRVGFCICPGRISHRSHQPAHPACLGPAVRWLCPWVYWPIPPVWCYLNTCQEYTVPPPGHWCKY